MNTHTHANFLFTCPCRLEQILTSVVLLLFVQLDLAVVVAVVCGDGGDGGGCGDAWLLLGIILHLCF
jgi:hypothetical protein